MSVELVDFLEAVCAPGWHSLCWQDPGGGPMRYRLHPDVASLAADPIAVNQNVHVWFGAHGMAVRPSEGRGTSDDVTAVRSLIADLDWADPTRRTTRPLPTGLEVRTRLARLGDELAPPVVVNSGHGLQCFWPLAVDIGAELADELQARLDARLAELGLENGRGDLASIMRLPGTRNVKRRAA